MDLWPHSFYFLEDRPVISYCWATCRSSLFIMAKISLLDINTVGSLGPRVPEEVFFFGVSETFLGAPVGGGRRF